MAIELNPDLGVPITPDTDFGDLRVAAAAACETARLLEENGLDLTPTDNDRGVAATLAKAYAEDPDKVNKRLTQKNLSTLTPASLIQTRAILDEFGRLVAHQASEIRHLVTNKLILETENPDARVRLRALEMLGKVSDVGLFTERTEVTITHQSTDDLKIRLREKLQRLKAIDVESREVTDINLDEELGL
jgi:hypothetical protein